MSVKRRDIIKHLKTQLYYYLRFYQIYPQNVGMATAQLQSIDTQQVIRGFELPKVELLLRNIYKTSSKMLS